MPTNALTGLLDKSVVKIEIGGERLGAGFFVAPAYVVTCAHVLDPLRGTTPYARPTLALVDFQGKRHEDVVDFTEDLEADLALIKLAEGDTSVAVVRLDETSEVGDETYAFGFTELYPFGTSVTFVVEGTAEGLIKLKGGQAEPGMSGAPLLNLRSGAVCGVVKRSRAIDIDLGGYAIRASTLYSAFERVRKLNADAHRGESPWLAELTPDQRRRVQPVPSAMAESDYVEFVISIDQQEDAWRVTATTYPDGRTVASVAVDLNCVRTEVPRLFRAWRAHGRIDDAEQARLLGRVLYRAIAPNPVCEELERLALREKKPVHISLCFEQDMDDDLKHLPWEQLFVEGPISGPLGATQQLTLTRVLDPIPLTDDASPGGGGFSVLVAVGPGPNALVAAADRLIADLKQLRIPVEAGEFSLEQVEQRVTQGGIAVFHYLGSGKYDRQSDLIAFSGGARQPDEIVFSARATGDPEFFGGDQLAQALFHNSPKIVVLQTCSAGSDVVPPDPTVLAPALLRAGVKAVIACPFPLQEDDAMAASKRLYQELASGRTVRAAVQESRRTQRRRPWSRAALFMKQPENLRLVAAVSQPARQVNWVGTRG